MKTFNEFINEIHKLKDEDEFTPQEIARIKDAHFPDTMRKNLRMKKADAAHKAWMDKAKGGSGGDSHHISPSGGSDGAW
jgi:hypothetical protein